MARHSKGRMTPKKLASFVLLMLMIICAIVMIYYGLIVVKPYTFTADFILSQCSPVTVSFNGRLDCICTMGTDSGSGTCVSEYPCAEITVRYRTDGSQIDQKAKMLKSFSANHRNVQCVLKACEEDPLQNNKTIYEFVQKYGNTASNASYPCFYNPDNLNEVILEKTPRSDVIVVMLWPSLGFLVCLVAMVIIQCALTDQQVGDQTLAS